MSSTIEAIDRNEYGLPTCSVANFTMFVLEMFAGGVISMYSPTVCNCLSLVTPRGSACVMKTMSSCTLLTMAT